MGKITSANLGFEEKLWAAADKMRNNMDPSEYKHVVLGLIFLKYISDSFEELHEKLKTDKLSDPEDKDEYLAENVFWVPQEARWNFLLQNARKAEIGKLVDDAMVAIEKENPSLKGVLPKDYARPTLDKQRLGELIDLIGTIGLGDKESRSKDVLGRVYEYFIGRFASAEGKGGGEFFTPASVVRLLVYMIEPFKGRVFDPCCGSGGMFVQSEKFIEAHGGRLDDVAIFGQESNATTWRLCKMNLAIRGIESKHILLGDSFHNDQHKDLKADFILANPPFNISDWGGERLREDVRWKYGVPPTGNANYAWIQHFIHHLSPTGIAGFVMANGSLSSNTSGEGEIRKNLIKNGLVDCIVAMPDKLFYTTQIPACLWFVSRDRYNNKFRDRHNEILFIDARKMGKMIDRRHRELTDEDITTISQTYHNWRNKNGKYEDIKGFCKAASIEEVEKNGYVLTPGRYVGTDFVIEDDEVFEEKMARLTKELSEQFQQSKELEQKIKENLEKVGFKI
jgi:type I restriction enzyme M protein